MKLVQSVHYKVEEFLELFVLCLLLLSCVVILDFGLYTAISSFNVAMNCSALFIAVSSMSGARMKAF